MALTPSGSRVLPSNRKIAIERDTAGTGRIRGNLSDEARLTVRFSSETRPDSDKVCWIGARLDKMSWVGARLDEVSWVEARLDKMSWVEARLDEGSWVGARLDEGPWVGSRLAEESRAAARLSQGFSNGERLGDCFIKVLAMVGVYFFLFNIIVLIQ